MDQNHLYRSISGLLLVSIHHFTLDPIFRVGSCLVPGVWTYTRIGGFAGGIWRPQSMWPEGTMWRWRRLSENEGSQKHTVGLAILGMFGIVLVRFKSFGWHLASQCTVSNGENRRFQLLKVWIKICQNPCWKAMIQISSSSRKAKLSTNLTDHETKHETY